MNDQYKLQINYLDFENQAIEIEKSCTKNNGGMKMKALASDFDRTLFFLR